MHELGDEALAQKVIDSLIEQAVVTDSEAYWNTGAEDGHYHEKTMSSSLRSTALALDALVRMRPDDPIIVKIVRWLMVHRALDGWGTTQETAYAVLALTDYLYASGELSSSSTYRVYVNDQLVQQGALGGHYSQQTIRIPAAQLRDGVNRVRLERDRSGGQLYYKITQQALIAGSADRAAGPIAVTRTYRDLKSDERITTALPGEVFEVELKVIMPHLFDEATNRDLLARLFGALAPGGKVAIIDVLPDEEMNGPREAILYGLGLLLRTSTGQAYPLSRYTEWLQSAGFTNSSNVYVCCLQCH